MPRIAPARRLYALSLVALMAAAPVSGAFSQELPPSQVAAEAGPTYADVADLARAANLVAIVTIRRSTPLPPDRAGNVAPGHARVYVEANTSALLVGSGLGESVAYLADVPLDARGRVPKLKKQQMIVFARSVPGRPDEIALVAPDAQLGWSPEREQQVRAILTAMVAPDAPPHVTGVREALFTPGNLAGEGESQIFLSTREGQPITLTVLRRPGQPPQWGLSTSELVGAASKPPQPDTLLWYRLACFLPASLPARANISDPGASAQQAAADYAFVMEQLGPCTRNRH